MNILDRIIEHKRLEVEQKKLLNPVPEKKQPYQPPHRPFDEALRREDICVITEFKKASPSKGIIRADAEPVDVARLYEANGAAAISVLTDETFFKGHADFLTAIQHQVSIPVLRKDFIIDEYQIREAEAMGASAILLIVSVLRDEELISFQHIAQTLGMHCLVEVHTDHELTRALDVDAKIIGINNRDLTDFTVDLNTSLTLKKQIPGDVITVSESGIYERQDVLALQSAGFDAILVGESLMRSEDIGGKLRELRGI